jgi:hypothetical protein
MLVASPRRGRLRYLVDCLSSVGRAVPARDVAINVSVRSSSVHRRRPLPRPETPRAARLRVLRLHHVLDLHSTTRLRCSRHDFGRPSGTCSSARRPDARRVADPLARCSTENGCGSAPRPRVESQPASVVPLHHRKFSSGAPGSRDDEAQILRRACPGAVQSPRCAVSRSARARRLRVLRRRREHASNETASPRRRPLQLDHRGRRAEANTGDGAGMVPEPRSFLRSSSASSYRPRARTASDDFSSTPPTPRRPAHRGDCRRGGPGSGWRARSTTR